MNWPRTLSTAFAAVSLLLFNLTAYSCSLPTSMARERAAAPSTPPQATSNHPAALWSAYAGCLRAHGFNEPDPTIDDQGNPHWQTNLDNLPPETEQVCEPYLQAAIRRGAPAPDEHQLAQRQRVAQCMRQHGVPNFPDPDPATGAFIMTGNSSIDPQSPQFQAALQACKGAKASGVDQ